jgi:hypothetical protein
MKTTIEAPRRMAGALAVATCLALGVSGATQVTSAQARTAAPSEQRAAVAHLEARLRPSGDPNGSGEAHFTLNKARHRVCATVEWHRIGRPNAAHIHRRSDGMILVDLTGSVTGGSHCARGVSGHLIGKLLRHPMRYYFNVHNTAHPDGAIQGRLHH